MCVPGPSSESEPSAIKFVFLMINIRGRSTPTRESFKHSVFKFKPLKSRLNELEDHLRVRRESVVAGTSSPSAFAVFRFIGCRRDRPLAHPGGAGLLWAIQGGRLVKLHRDWAVIELAANGSRRVFERRRVDAGNVTLPWIE